MRRVLVFAMLAAFSATVRATVLIPIEFRELVTASSTIVRGRVVDVRAEWIDGRRSLETFVTLETEEYYKGSLGGTITVRTPGGQMGRYRTIFVGAPEFRTGEEVILFLRGNGSVARIVGLSQGAYRVVSEASGRRVVMSPVVMGKSENAEPVVRGDAMRRPLAIDAFRDLVKRVVATGGAQ